MNERWEHFQHGADVGVRGFGPTRESAFEQAALALQAVMTDPGQVAPAQRKSIVCEAGSDELLFVDWMDALIYETAVNRLVFSRFEVHLTPGRLDASAWGETVRPEHEPAVEVKGATFTELKVGQAGGEWVAQCVVDV